MFAKYYFGQPVSVHLLIYIYINKQFYVKFGFWRISPPIIFLFEYAFMIRKNCLWSLSNDISALFNLECNIL